MKRFVALACLLALPAQAAPPATVPNACEGAIVAAERRAQTAPGLLRAIGLVESGRADPRTGARRPWPWTVTAEGVGTYYPTKAEAVAAVEALQTRGVASVDVGCMQVNLQYHPAAFRSLDDAFEPGLNASYAARFLLTLHTKVGDWPAAAAAYHSFTPGLAAGYAKLIAAVWSGAPVPIVKEPNGAEIVRFPGGGEMRMFRSAGGRGRGRVVGVLD